MSSADFRGGVGVLETGFSAGCLLYHVTLRGGVEALEGGVMIDCSDLVQSSDLI